MKLMISCAMIMTAILASIESVNSQAENCIAPAPPDLDCKDVILSEIPSAVTGSPSV